MITQLDENDIEQPVGIVTERDIVQFQALQIDLAKTSAQIVMSSPLFLLSPQDSLWTAHQEMQTRKVGRLVVSWNWGQGLGIVTQTSLLRVFDPMEMYGVIENLQQTIQQMEAKQTAMTSPLASPPLNTQDTVLASTITSSEEQESDIPPKVNTCDPESLNHLYHQLKQVVEDATLSPSQQKTALNLLLDRLKQLSVDCDLTVKQL